MGTRSTSGPDKNHDPLPLRGRHSEWTRIIDLLRQAGRGHRCVLVIDGPGGSGRTRLLTELVLTARQKHCIVFERSGPIPYPDLRRLAWECEQLAARLTALPPGTATGPVLVAWDDAGIADRTGTDRTGTDRTGTDRTVGNPGWTGVERFPALNSTSANPILWALAPRAGEGLTIAGILGAPRVIDVQLRPLPTAAGHELLADLLGATPAPDLAHLAAVASGNPRALVDLVDGLLDEGLIEVDARGGTSVARLTSVRLPGRCAFRVRGQLDRLTAPARHLVQVASAAGPSFQVSELAGLMRETAAGLLPMIEEALSSGLIVPADDGLAFSHELVCDIVADTLPQSIRAALREEVDRARATRPAPQPAPQPAPGPAGRREAPVPEGPIPEGPVPEVPAERAALPASAGWDRLSDTELEIARLVSQALTNRQIATRVYLSPHTINYHLRQIYRKLEINSRVQLANLAQAQNLGQAGTVDSTSDPTSDSTS